MVDREKIFADMFAARSRIGDPAFWERVLCNEGMPAELPLLTDNPSMFVPFDEFWQIANAPTPDVPSIRETPDRWEFLRDAERKLPPGRIRCFVAELIEQGSRSGMKGEYPGYWTVAQKHGIDWRAATRILRKLEIRHLILIGEDEAALRIIKKKRKQRGAK